jgi:hypothetical protein
MNHTDRLTLAPACRIAVGRGAFVMFSGAAFTLAGPPPR